MADFVIKSGDTLDSLDATLQGADGAAIDLTGATVVFSMQRVDGALVITEAAATVVDAVGGTVTYGWQTGDTDVAGGYWGEFEVTFASGGIATFPNDRHLSINILEALA